MAELEVTDRTRLRRRAERGRYDVATVHAILDEALTCHVGFVVDGAPVVIPTIHARVGTDLFVHGAVGNRMLRAIDGAEVCITVTLVDGVVLARSWFHHSCNYRSVVVFGRAERVKDPEDARAAMAALVEHVVPGRTTESRPPTAEEMRATAVLRVPIREASAKVRVGGPVEEPADLALAHWAGELPLALVPGPPVPDEATAARAAPPPPAVAEWHRPGPQPSATTSR